LIRLETRVRTVGTKLARVIENGVEPAETDAFERSKHILDKIEEPDWYQSWSAKTDDLDLNILHLELPSQTQTGHMASHVVSLTNVLTRLAGAVGLEEETTKKLHGQTQILRQRYRSALWKVKNDWTSSGMCALKQLKTAVEIMDGDIFVDPANYEGTSVKHLMPWMLLMMMYAPSASLKRKFKWWLEQPDASIKDFREDLEPLVRAHSRQLFTELLFLANSRLAHRILIERYKTRCEIYDWKQIMAIIQDHARKVAEEAAEADKRPVHRFEDLLTLHLARYLYDSGYPVHYTPRHGVHEPDLLGRSANDLESVVVEAKVVGQQYGTVRGVSWIEKGLRALLAYLQRYYSDYGVTDGYLIILPVFSPPKAGSVLNRVL
jgi:hypothetical protein